LAGVTKNTAVRAALADGFFSSTADKLLRFYWLRRRWRAHLGFDLHE